MSEEKNNYTLEEPVGGVRWLDGPQQSIVLQQRWAVTHYVDRMVLRTEVVWRDVPTVTESDDG